MHRSVKKAASKENLRRRRLVSKETSWSRRKLLEISSNTSAGFIGY